MDWLSSKLKKQFGISSLRPLQEEIIQSICDGNSTLAILPTGYGKSLTYQLPVFLLEGTVVVISPLLSLIQDQIDSLLEKEIHAIRIDSTLTPEQREKNLLTLKNGDAQILYTSPESIANKDFQAVLQSIEISLVAIDEAHCYSEWGHSFRPSYLSLPAIVRKLNPKATLALTATATKKVASQIRKAFRIKLADQFSVTPRRDNLSYRIFPTQSEHRTEKLIAILRQEDHLPAIVYVMKQEQCETIAHALNEANINARSYHAGMSADSRFKVQHAFITDEVEVIVATIAFGMGVDKPNIRCITHYHLPKSPEGWMQESGRAGRDGKPAYTYLLACADDLIPLTNFSKAKELEQKTTLRLLEILTAQGRHTSISPYHTRVLLDIQTSTLDGMLAQLERMKAIRFTGTSWRYIKMNVLYGRSLDLSDYPRNTRKIIEHILEIDDRYDTHQCQEDFSIPLASLQKCLEQIQLSGDCWMRFSGWQKEYTILPLFQKNESLPSVSAQLFDHHQTELALAQERLDAVIRICTSRICIPKQLDKWFGHSNSEPCGNCSSCQKEKRPRKLPSQKLPEISEQQLEEIHALLKQKANRFRTPQQLTRFLCGIAAPYLRHYRLHFHSSFGMLSHYPHDDVYAYSKAILG